MPQELNDGDLSKLLKSDEYVLVDFYATWCGPCKKIAPELDKLEPKYKQVTFVKVNVEECPETAAKYKIEAMPTFLFFKKGHQTQMIRGARLEEIKEALGKLIDAEH